MTITPPIAHDTRNADPETSLAAMVKAAKASAEAVRRVRALMRDGKARTDEEIWRDLRTPIGRDGYCRSQATIRHARVALSRAGMLRDTGERRATTDGGDSVVWQIPPQPKGQLALVL